MSSQNRKSFPLTISSLLFEEIEATVKKIKTEEDYSCSKQQWILQAIREKIKREKERLLEDQINSANKAPSDRKRMSLMIEEELVEEINSLVQIKRNQGDNSFSKKSWITEALLEKLEAEKT